MHLVVTIHSKLMIADLIRRVKSVFSMVGRKACGGFVGWQDNYGVTRVSPRHRDLVIAYVTNQKQHHANGTTWPGAEAYPDEIERTVAVHPEDG